MIIRQNTDTEEQALNQRQTSTGTTADPSTASATFPSGFWSDPPLTPRDECPELVRTVFHKMARRYETGQHFPARSEKSSPTIRGFTLRAFPWLAPGSVRAIAASLLLFFRTPNSGTISGSFPDAEALEPMAQRGQSGTFLEAGLTGSILQGAAGIRLPAAEAFESAIPPDTPGSAPQPLNDLHTPANTSTTTSAISTSGLRVTGRLDAQVRTVSLTLSSRKAGQDHRLSSYTVTLPGSSSPDAQTVRDRLLSMALTTMNADNGPGSGDSRQTNPEQGSPVEKRARILLAALPFLSPRPALQGARLFWTLRGKHRVLGITLSNWPSHGHAGTFSLEETTLSLAVDGIVCSSGAFSAPQMAPHHRIRSCSAVLCALSSQAQRNIPRAFPESLQRASFPGGTAFLHAVPSLIRDASEAVRSAIRPGSAVQALFTTGVRHVCSIRAGYPGSSEHEYQTLDQSNAIPRFAGV